MLTRLPTILQMSIRWDTNPNRRNLSHFYTRHSGRRLPRQMAKISQQQHRWDLAREWHLQIQIIRREPCRPMPARQRFASAVPAFSQYVALIMAPIIPEAVISPGHWITWATVYLRPPKDRKSLIIRAIQLCSQMEHLATVFLLVPMERLRIKRQMAPIFQQDNRWHCISSTIQKVWKNQETVCLKQHRHPAWL